MAFATLEKLRAYNRAYAKSPKYRAWRKAWFRTVPGRAYKAAAMRRRQTRHRLWLDGIKQKLGCVECRFRKWPEALDFDHKNRKQKAFNISQHLGLSKTALMKEIRKCVVRCANCHRHRTKKENPNGFRK